MLQTGRKINEETRVTEALVEAQSLALMGRELSVADTQLKQAFEQIFQILRVAQGRLAGASLVDRITEQRVWKMLDLEGAEL